MAEVESRETVRGAERAKDLMESMMKECGVMIRILFVDLRTVVLMDSSCNTWSS